MISDRKELKINLGHWGAGVPNDPSPHREAILRYHARDPHAFQRLSRKSRMSRARVSWPAYAVLIGTVTLPSCAGNEGTEPVPTAPVIVIDGVSDGAELDGPVTITISVDVGTYSATLNGADFFSGSTVSGPGSYLLQVEASYAGKSSSASISFVIRFGTGGVLIIRMFDLGDNDSGGGGDAILLTDSTSAGQRHVMIDAGPAGAGASDAGFVEARLDALGVDSLEALVLSHAHTDHFDGMEDILRGAHVRNFYYNGQVRALARYENLIALAGVLADERIVAEAALIDFSIGTAGGTTLQVLPPLATYLSDPGASSTEINEGSLGVALSRGSFRMFFTGDSEVEANQRWRTQFPTQTQSLTALKVGHHGANDAIFDNGSFGVSSWIDHADATMQLISANGASHPRIRALNLLLSRSLVATYCTHVHGDIEVRVDVEGAHTVAVERNAGMDCVPGDDASS